MQAMFDDERDLWKYLSSRIRGDWTRIEAILPEGVPDVFGIVDTSFVWIELKIGVPNIALVRPAQRRFLRRWWRAGGNAFVVFGTSRGVVWHADLSFVTPVPPPHWATGTLGGGRA